jgi:hypothetical protein
MQAVTNEQQAARIVGEVEAVRDATKKAADLFMDLDPAAPAEAAQVEGALTRFWKMTALPPAALAEDIFCQTNAYCANDPFNGRPWQNEALDFTRAFRARFPQWAAAYEQQAKADTNKPPFTAEAQAEISALATEVEKLQGALVEQELPPKMLEVLEKLRRIQELMPKDGGGQSSQNAPQQQPPQKDDRQKDGQNGQDQENKPQEENQDRQDNQPEEQKPEERQEQAQQAPEDKPDREVEALLQKAQERSEAHENEKKARMRKAPLAPNARDW